MGYNSNYRLFSLLAAYPSLPARNGLGPFQGEMSMSNEQVTEVWFGLVGRLFGGKESAEVVTTPVHFHATPEAVWQGMLLYEDVPVRPPFLLRALLPYPVRTQGDKTRVGATIQCTYQGGDLVKRIQVVEQPHFLKFEVLQQRLGIESCVVTVGGSYAIESCGDNSKIVLTTNYLGHLRPRALWRPVERFMAHQLHRHILDGMRASLPRGSSRHSTARAARG
jgi:hypothetical protein